MTDHPNRDQWISSKDMAEFLSGRRNNDIRVRLRGVNVPIIDVHYDRMADMIIIELDGEDFEYKVALSSFQESELDS